MRTLQMLTCIGLLAGWIFGSLGCNAGGIFAGTLDVKSDGIIVVAQDVGTDEEQFVQTDKVGFMSVESITVLAWDFVVMKPDPRDVSKPSLAEADQVAVIPFVRVINSVSTAKIPESLEGVFFIQTRLTFKYNADIAKETPEKPAQVRYRFDPRYAPFSRTACGPRPGYTGSQSVIDLGTRPVGVATDFLLESFVDAGAKPFQ